MRLKCNIQIQKVGRRYIGVAVGDDTELFPGMLRMNDTTRDIVLLLRDDISREDIIRRMLDMYDTDTETMTEYVDDVLEMLRNYKLLQ